jgi:hypothetical protein
MLFGWCSPTWTDVSQHVLRRMARALRVSPRQQVHLFSEPYCAVGLIVLPPLADSSPYVGSTESAGGRHALWMAGEAFSWDGEPLMPDRAAQAAFRVRLLNRLAAEGGRAICDLNGEYQLALWDRTERTLTLFSDRFAALPLYWSNNNAGFAFASGVRGVLMAPDVECAPDVDALRQAVTFGGFRLGRRTNVAGVEMLPPAAELLYRRAQVAVRRYWSWDEAPAESEMADAERLRITQSMWQQAIRARLEGSRRPGLLLSGGLDSRAILAEAAQQSPRVSAISYGVPQCDDVRFARRAARAAAAEWELFPLYAEGWLDRRVSQIHHTDGLIDLVDLMHTEVLPYLAGHMDMYLSGYIGDLVSGSTYLDVNTVEDVLHAMPYYGGTLGMPSTEATALAESMLADTSGAGHFVTYDHKLPQSTNRVTAAARPWVHVRRPFTDYRFWSQAYGVPRALRRDHQWHERWLRSTYTRLFSIPNQRTAAPAGASRMRVQATRVARYGIRRAYKAAAGLGLPVTPPERMYHPDWPEWRRTEIRARITETVLRPGSIAAEIFGHAAVSDTLRAYFERDAAPTQVVGALFVFEQYHQQLSASLRASRAEDVAQ